MSKNKVGFLEFIKFYKENHRAFKIYPMRDKARTQLTLCNIELAKMNVHSKAYFECMTMFNHGMIYLYSGKWNATTAIKSKNKHDWKRAFDDFKTSIDIANSLYGHLTKGTPLTDYNEPLLNDKDGELKYYGHVPLVPEITPIVILQGTNREMGAQYCDQLIEIYGDWILKRHKKSFTDDELNVIGKWEQVHREYTPEIIEFAEGWSERSKELGIDLDYVHVLNLWTGHKSPTQSYLNAESGIPELPPLACASLAAWNTATDDGNLVVVSSGDHDMSYQLVIAMYPVDGNALVFTTFEATGTLPTVGPNWFFGHPGMNDKGLAYAHHGGGPKLLEPRSSWGYGLRRGASVIHNLMNHSSTKESFEFEMSCPVGDVGYGDQATVGGFYVDNQSGYVIESRIDPVCVRKPGILGEKDYLFSNNSAMHPGADQSEWMKKIEKEIIWDEIGGWRPKAPQGMSKSIGMLFKWFTGRLDMQELMSKGMMFTYWNSYNRNVFLNEKAKEAHGRINENVVKDIFRTGGTMPKKPFDQAKRDYKKTGEWGRVSSAHASNAIVTVMKPAEGLFSVCTGPAKRGMAPMSPDLAISIYNERNTFWDFRLSDSPQTSLEEAEKLARDLSTKALTICHKSSKSLLVEQLEEELRSYIDQIRDLNGTSQSTNLMTINKKIRLFCKIHVVSRQILEIH
ncbi:hypothetical protein [Fusibacter sp. JL216-2]|uniref:hypothetical protein n=1 Tax=Fusibacter sp. JL216-2 TaxID=3071453 RepID=UPI003D3381E6